MANLIKEAIARRDDLIQKANNDWLTSCQILADLIPTSLRAFALEYGWIKTEGDDWWMLPERLESMTKEGAHQAAGATLSEFETIEHAQAAFDKLNTAWAGFVHVDVDYRDWPRFEVILTPANSSEN